MRIYRLAAPLPLDEIPIERGETHVDCRLTKEEIASLQKKFKLVRKLGSGHFGIAYLTQDNKVLKITTDTDEVTAANDLLENKHGPFAKIYQVGRINFYLYYILKERVTPLSENEKDMMIDINDAIDNDEYVYDVDAGLETRMYEYITEAQNLGLSDMLSPDNVGKDGNGNIVCFDVRMSY